MRKRIISVFILLAVVFSLQTAFAAPSPWAASEVNSAKASNLVPEALQDNYQDSIIREDFCEMVMLLYTYLGGTLPEAGASAFADTDNESVSIAAQLEIVTGVGDGLFAPDSLITRQEICTMLKRTLEKAKPDLNIPQTFFNDFPDAHTIADWAYSAVQLMNSLEIMLGDESYNINPLSNTTREQAILLVYRTAAAFAANIFDMVEAMGLGLVQTGNTSSNMYNGSFAITAADKKLYLSDSTGIYILNDDMQKTYIATEEAFSLYVSYDAAYYVKKSDGRIYSNAPAGGQEKLLCDAPASYIAVSANYIYSINPETAHVFHIPVSGGAAEEFIAAPCTAIAASGNSVYYSDSEGIHAKNLSSNEVQTLYSGAVEHMVIDNGILYFKNGDGFVCSLEGSGENPFVITKTPVAAFCAYNNGIAYTTSQGLYKSDFSGKFAIRLSTGAFVNINSYGKYLFGKTADGEIYKIAINGLEHFRLNY